MATTYLVLGQSNPAANTNADLYTVGSGKQALISTISVCNQGATPATYRIAIRKSGAAIAAQHYLAYDAPLPANGSDLITAGLTAGAGDIVTVRASSATVSFSAFGGEVT